jgi:hypothetical protein
MQDLARRKATPVDGDGDPRRPANVVADSGVTSALPATGRFVAGMR